MKAITRALLLPFALFTLCFAVLSALAAYNYMRSRHSPKSQVRERVEAGVNEEHLAVELCASLVPNQLDQPEQATLVGTPRAQLVDSTWLVTGYVDVPKQSGALYRHQWACGVSISLSCSVAQHKVQFVTVDQREVEATRPEEE